MTYKTHVLGGIVLAAGVVVATPVPISDAQAVTILCGGAIGALLPDIDHTGAKISRSGILADIQCHRTQRSDAYSIGVIDRDCYRRDPCRIFAGEPSFISMSLLYGYDTGYIIAFDSG